jgi:hypothetical protein
MARLRLLSVRFAVMPSQVIAINLGTAAQPEAVPTSRPASPTKYSRCQRRRSHSKQIAEALALMERLRYGKFGRTPSDRGARERERWARARSRCAPARCAGREPRGREQADRHCQSKFYTSVSRAEASGRRTVFAQLSHWRPARSEAENRLYSIALTMPVSWLTSIPRSARRSSTLRSDSGYLSVHHHDKTDDLRRAVEISERIAHCLSLPLPEASPAFGLTELEIWSDRTRNRSGASRRDIAKSSA